MDIFRDAQKKFRSGLSPKDRALLSEKSSADEVLSEVESLEEQCRDQSRTFKLVKQIDPFIRAVEQYGKALDQFANAKPEILGIIWGSTCIIIRV